MKNPAALVLVGSALLLASCNRNSVPAVQPNVASGKVVELAFDPQTGWPSYTPWSGGAGKVVASVEGKPELATASLGADGSFSLTLPTVDSNLLVTPDPADFSTELPDNCTGSLTFSGANDAKSATAAFSVQAQKGGEIAPLALSETADSATFAAGLYVYFNKAVGLSGKVTCIENNTTATGDVNVQFVAGWNVVSVSVTGTATSTQISMKTGTLPGNWVYLGDGATQLSLKSQNLERRALGAVKSIGFPLFR
ncbi:hypothetical protein [Deinococcus apachensis]|uniref:hypothetical protein n=1 Tax=Deinococcus apachensis TaxID=309886 RepID=UPI0012F7E1D6|nr:hypothetical protein [Deinococcus apachensis]